MTLSDAQLDELIEVCQRADEARAGGKHAFERMLEFQHVSRVYFADVLRELKALRAERARVLEVVEWLREEDEGGGDCSSPDYYAMVAETHERLNACFQEPTE